MDNLINKNSQTADTAEAENFEAAQVVGKFKDVKALENAYISLQAEFTRRSQRLKELEANNAQRPPENSENGQAPSQSALTEVKGEELLKMALSDEQVKAAVIGDYLKTVMQNKSVPLITGGMQVSAERQAPKTVKEAGKLAAQFLKL
ncbi:MAG: hypothetical protein J6B04_02430 [Clostridia bacterium]|nr:hypothetical protein [Clostridia bacterium]